MPCIGSDLYSVPNAIAGVDQEWHLERTDGNLLRVTVFSTVDSSEWATASYFIAFDYLTEDSFYFSWNGPSTDSSTTIHTVAEAQAICADWLVDHMAPYIGATEVEWNQVWIADLPNWNTWSWSESIDVSLDWWADWDAGGARFSNSEPIDFGSWLWDGSPIP